MTSFQKIPIDKTFKTKTQVSDPGPRGPLFIMALLDMALLDMRGAQWLSGRVLDSRPKGSGFEPHRRHCVVVLGQDTFILA